MFTAKQYKKLPETPGVYLMKGAKKETLYVGKAGNLRRRVSSYFERPHDIRIAALVRKIKGIDFRPTDTALEALILEAELIKTIRPPFNIREKDDKSFLYIEITKETFPRVLLVRGKDAEHGRRFGPFTSASSVRHAFRILRKIFPWSTHASEQIGASARPCFDYEIGLCPGTCVGRIARVEYNKHIGRLTLFLEGKKKMVLRSLEKEMAAAAKKMDFEQAEKFQRQIFALQHIRDIAFIAESEIVVPGADARVGDTATGGRIEGYDISNISGTSAVGSMVVFDRGVPNKDEYRTFKIRTVFQPNDVGMLTEMLTRRFRHLPRTALPSVRGSRDTHGTDRAYDAWALPDLILIDGGIAQANAAKKVLLHAGLRIPILGLAKGPERKRNDILGAIPKWTDKKTLIRVRDEAHRCAIGYHKNLRRRNTFL